MLLATTLKLLASLVVLLQPVRCEVTSETATFIATFPSSVIAGTSAQFCIRFQHLGSSDVNVTITDNAPHLFETINELVNANEGAETCLSIPIRKRIEENTYNQEIIVSGRAVESEYRFKDSKYFSVKMSNNFNLIETDKPVYKPGQVVRIRILSINNELAPVPKVFKEIFIEDSSQSRVSQWIDVKSASGNPSFHFDF